VKTIVDLKLGRLYACTFGHGKVIKKTLPFKERGVLGIVPFGGDRGIRTPDLRDANAALSQLSYIPSSNNKDYNIYPPCQSVTLLLY
jgi:hypothetical protein